MIQQFQASYEKRHSELAQENGAFWRALADKYGLDVQKVMYVPSADGESIVPQQMVLI